MKSKLSIQPYEEFRKTWFRMATCIDNQRDWNKIAQEKYINPSYKQIWILNYTRCKNDVKTKRNFAFQGRFDVHIDRTSDFGIRLKKFKNGNEFRWNRKIQTCNSLFIGTGLFRSRMISAVALSWLDVSVYGRTFMNLFVTTEHSSTNVVFKSGLVYLSRNPSFSSFVPRPSSIWNNFPNWTEYVPEGSIKTLILFTF